MDWISSKGKIQYDPPRPNKLKRRNWWAIVKVDREITRYFRYWVKKELWIDLCQPSFNAHISVVRGEKPAPHLMKLWKKYDNRIIDFKYSLSVRQSGDTTGWDRPNHFWFVEIDCPFLLDIRRELERPCDWKLHLTIGRTWDH